MKIRLKNKEEISIMMSGGRILKDALAYAKSLVTPGISTQEIDLRVEEFILKHPGATPAFKGYNGFPATLCTSVNDEVVHAEPSKYILKEGDIISIDCGVKYKGYYTDAAITVAVGNISEQTKKLIDTTKKSLDLAIKKLKVGLNFKETAKIIQQEIEENGFSVVRDLVGHGIGKNLHEDPQIPNFVPPYPLPNIREGMTFCIEPMVNMGTPEVIFSEKTHAIKTKDGSISCHFEHTLAIVENQAIIIA